MDPVRPLSEDEQLLLCMVINWMCSSDTMLLYVLSQVTPKPCTICAWGWVTHPLKSSKKTSTLVGTMTRNHPFQDPEAAESRDRLAARLYYPAPCGDHDYHAVI
ncbi:hypothetical protein MTO96_032181 [Rhipicephalus appendiculatus]